MTIQPDAELRDICRQIVAEGRSEAEWSAIESDDWFQSANYVGGYDATEHAFCFSYLDSDRKEWWFQLSYEEAGRIAAGAVASIELRNPA
jgi:hypothetical protein